MLSTGTYTLEANATSGLGLTFVSNNTAVATIAGNVVTLVSGGNAQITASQGGNAVYNSATAMVQTLVVQDDTVQPQIITWTQDLSNLVFGDTVNLNATASSGAPVTYSSSNSTVGAVSGNVLNIVGAGTATITATQAGGVYSGNEWQAASTTKVATIAKAAQTINFAAIPNQLLTTGTYTLEANATSGLGLTFVSDNTAVATIAGNVVTLLSGGNAQITATQGGNSAYLAATDVTQALTVQVPNNPPADLNSTTPLTIAENQPIGTVVGEFNATDPDR